MDERISGLKTLRRMLKIPAKETAKEIGITPEFLYEIEAGRQDLMNYKKREKLFEVYEDYKKRAEKLIEQL